MPILTAVSEVVSFDSIVKGLNQSDIAAIIFFYSVDLDGNNISAKLKKEFPDAMIIGCSMIGGLYNTKPIEKGVTAISIGKDIAELAFVEMETGFKNDPENCSEKLINKLERKIPHNANLAEEYLGILLIDGLGLGEILMRRLMTSSKLDFPIVGGAAADNLTFTGTKITVNGIESDDAIAMLVLKVKVPFYYDQFVHYKTTGKKVLVTKADPKKRIVWELDNQPAADVYAKLIGKSKASDLSADDFFLHPLGYSIGKTIYTRSPREVSEGNGLSFYCWLEVGNEIQLLERGDILKSAEETIELAKKNLNNNIQGAILFNCVLRYLELKNDNKLEKFYSNFSQFPCIGFNTYGEELFSHLNQTLTAVFFGKN